MHTVKHGTEASSSEDHLFALFIRLWVLILLLERVGRFTFFSFSGPENTPSFISISYALLLILTFLFPTRVILVGLTLVSHYLVIWVNNNNHPLFISTIVPFFTHWFLAFSIHLCILLALLRGNIERAWPVIRLILISSLIFAGFAKLNRLFLFSEYGCGMAFYHGLLNKFGIGFGLSALSSYMPFITLFVELICPILLFFQKTRIFASICIWFLMAMLGYLPSPNTLYDFAGIYLIGLLLFQSKQAISETNKLIEKYFSNRFLVAVTIISFTVIGVIIDRTFSHKLTNILTFIIWTLFCYLIFRTILKSVKIPSNITFKIGVAGALWLIIFCYKESMPFLGNPHQSNFNMASSLSISRLYSNHLFITKVPKLEINKIARIINSEDIRLIPGQYFAWGGLRNYLLLNTGKKVTFEIDNQIMQTPIVDQSIPYFISNFFKKHIILPQIINPKDLICKVHAEKDSLYKK